MPQRTCSLPGCEKRHVARGLCSTHYNRARYSAEERHPHELRSCVICGTTVRRRVDNRHAPTCSVDCRYLVQFGEREAVESAYTWRRDAVDRARDYGAVIVEVFDRVEIFERDGWRCQLCGITCRQPSPFDRCAATVDHVVPLALGGEHSRANAQTACLSCNGRKQASISPAA